jgi:two-component system CheB/CheR fusion protein
VEGVVITFNDFTSRRKAAADLEKAKASAEAANLAKSRFLAAASHDLRQPLQTLSLLQSLLAKTVAGDKAAELVKRQDETLGAMSGMLDTLLDLNQIEAGVVKAKFADFRISSLLWKTAWKSDPALECAPGSGHFQSAVLTVCWACWLSNWAGLR